MFGSIYWDPNPVLFTIPWLHWPILWYSVLFALGFVVGFPLFVSIAMRYYLFRQHPSNLQELRAKIVLLADRLTLYLILATIIGARIGHYLFYEKPSDYLNHIGEIFQIWKGGLASHGAALAIVIALVIFVRRYKDQFQSLSVIRLLDFLSIPAALAAALIRIGNFFNQEILGTKTQVPWAVIFGHPADRSAPFARHPVQLYESFFYFCVFLLLWRLSYHPKILLRKGKLIGLFLILVFGFRMVAEYWKVEQSLLLPKHFFLTMGQMLSIPAIIAGTVLFFWHRVRDQIKR